MDAINELIDKATKGVTPHSDYQLGKVLGKGRTAVSNWRHLRAFPINTDLAKLCIYANEDLTKWLPKIEALKAKTEEERTFWMNWGHAATFAGVAVFASASSLFLQAKDYLLKHRHLRKTTPPPARLNAGFFLPSALRQRYADRPQPQSAKGDHGRAGESWPLD